MIRNLFFLQKIRKEQCVTWCSQNGGVTENFIFNLYILLFGNKMDTYLWLSFMIAFHFFIHPQFPLDPHLNRQCFLFLKVSFSDKNWMRIIPCVRRRLQKVHLWTYLLNFLCKSTKRRNILISVSQIGNWTERLAYSYQIWIFRYYFAF